MTDRGAARRGRSGGVLIALGALLALLASRRPRPRGVRARRLRWPPWSRPPSRQPMTFPAFRTDPGSPCSGGHAAGFCSPTPVRYPGRRGGPGLALLVPSWRASWRRSSPPVGRRTAESPGTPDRVAAWSQDGEWSRRRRRRPPPGCPRGGGELEEHRLPRAPDEGVESAVPTPTASGRWSPTWTRSRSCPTGRRVLHDDPAGHDGFARPVASTVVRVRPARGSCRHSTVAGQRGSPATVGTVPCPSRTHRDHPRPRAVAAEEVDDEHDGVGAAVAGAGLPHHVAVGRDGEEHRLPTVWPTSPVHPWMTERCRWRTRRIAVEGSVEDLAAQTCPR
jgi:hypothetical protein